MGVLPQSRASGATSDGTVVVVNECMKRGRGGGGGGGLAIMIMIYIL